MEDKTFKDFKGKCLYTTKGAAREYGTVGCNFYRGCPLQCSYCYNRHGITRNVLGVDHAVLDDCFTKESNRPKKYRHLSPEDYAMLVFTREFNGKLEMLRRTGIFFSFSTDPMLEETRSLTWRAANVAVEHGVPVTILTKCAGTWTYYDWFMNQFNVHCRHLVSFGFTLTGRDDQEQGAFLRKSSTAERILAMERLKQMGYKVWASIEPVVDFTNSLHVIILSLPYCDHYKIGLMSGTRKDYYGTPDDLDRFVTTVRKLIEGRPVTVYWKESVRRALEPCGLLSLLEHSQFIGDGFEWFLRQ